MLKNFAKYKGKSSFDFLTKQTAKRTVKKKNNFFRLLEIFKN